MFRNVGIARCLDPEVGIFTASPFLEYFPILDLSFSISENKYRELILYLLPENYKKEIQRLVYNYNEKAISFKLPFLNNNVFLQFEDGIE
jgi:hypothetical protein